MSPLKLVLTLTFIALAPNAVLAQSMPPGPPGPPPQFNSDPARPAFRHRPPPPKFFGRMEMSTHVEGHIAFLKTELKITQAQTRAWDRYAAYMREAAKDFAAERPVTAPSAAPNAEATEPPARPTRKPLLERLAAREKHLQERLRLAEAQKAAAEGLFKVLTDEQKAIAEDLLR